MFKLGITINNMLAKTLYAEDFVIKRDGLTSFMPINLKSYGELGFKPILQITYNNNIEEQLDLRLQILLLSMVIFVAVVSYILMRFGTRRFFLNRLNSLNEQINKKQLGDHKRIELAGNDELSTLANEVDKLMKRMELQVVENLRLYNDSKTDSLTQIANRKHFDEQLSIEWKQAQRLNSDFSILMLDIDFFKEYNDIYGHLAGDTCLRMLATCVDSVLTRPRDFVARYGGEEFLCVLPETDHDGASKIAHQVCKSICDLKIEHEGSTVSNYITVSVGCYTLNGSSSYSETDVISEVDKLMYESKQSGKNRVTVKQQC